MKKVLARWNIKDASGWHNAGDVFETEEDLGDAVEVLEASESVEKAPAEEPEPVKEEKPARTASRRKTK